ncbi:MAG: hypothetical protein ACRERR_08805 [Moraxellaceae bacterium]
MNPSKRLGVVLTALSVLMLSACGEEEPLERNMAPASITVFQALTVAEEVGGLALDDLALADLVSAGSDAVGATSLSQVLGAVGTQTVLAASADPIIENCTGGGSRTDTESTVDGYDHHTTFNACKKGALTLNGSVEFYEQSDVRRAQFNGLKVDTAYDGGTLSLVLTGALEREQYEDGDDEYDDLDIASLSIRGTVTKSGRSVPLNLEIYNYSRALYANSVGNVKTLNVSGRIVKTGDYGSYDIDFSNIPVDGADTLRQQFSSGYFADHFTTGAMYISDRIKTSNFLSIAASKEYVGDKGEIVEAGKYMHFTGKIDALDYNALLAWTSLKQLFILDIVEKI